jgi:hypothetical protein
MWPTQTLLDTRVIHTHRQSAVKQPCPADDALREKPCQRAAHQAGLAGAPRACAARARPPPAACPPNLVALAGGRPSVSVGPSGTPLACQRLPTSMEMSVLFTQQSKNRPAAQCASMYGAGVLQQYAHQALSSVLKRINVRELFGSDDAAVFFQTLRSACWSCMAAASALTG